MEKLFTYDPYLADEDIDLVEMATDDLFEICKRLIDEYKTVVKYGFFGAWDGPKFGGAFITDPKILYGHITQEFRVPMYIELMYTDKDDTVSEIQRYCGSTELEVPVGSLVLLQHHHDGCNQYIIRPSPNEEEFTYDCGFIEWCERYSYPINKAIL